MFRQKPIGRRHIKVCRTLSCALMGGYKTCAAFEQEFNTHLGEVSPDGEVTIEFRRVPRQLRHRAGRDDRRRPPREGRRRQGQATERPDQSRGESKAAMKKTASRFRRSAWHRARLINGFAGMRQSGRGSRPSFRIPGFAGAGASSLPVIYAIGGFLAGVYRHVYNFVAPPAGPAASNRPDDKP